jgi:hypothetical protein
MTPQPQKLSKQSGSITSPPSAPGGGFAGGAPMTPQPQQDRCVLTRHDVQSIKDLVFIVGGNSESSAQKAIFEILANNMRRSRPAPAPETCKKYWNYRADSGHLYHLLYDLLGVMPTPETLGDALMQVRDRDTAIRKAERERVLDEIPVIIRSDKDCIIRHNGFDYIRLIDVDVAVESMRGEESLRGEP